MRLFSRKSASVQRWERRERAEAELQDLLALFVDEDDGRLGASSRDRSFDFLREATPRQDELTSDDI